jgi:hypothetical protein
LVLLLLLLVPMLLMLLLPLLMLLPLPSPYRAWLPRSRGPCLEDAHAGVCHGPVC